MKTLKHYLNAMAISIASFTVLSTLLYTLLGRGSVQLINPFGMNYTAKIDANGHIVATYTTQIFISAIVVYAVFGIAATFIPWVFKNEHLKLWQATIINYLATLFVFMGLAIWTNWNIGFFDFSKVLSSIILITIGYIFIWIGAFFYYRYQIKKLNQKLNS